MDVNILLPHHLNGFVVVCEKGRVSLYLALCLCDAMRCRGDPLRTVFKNT